MATSTFDREIEINTIEAAKRLLTVMESEATPKPLSDHPFTKVDRDRGEELLRQCLLRSKR